MKKMKHHELQRCSFCEEKTQAVWKSKGVVKGKYACDQNRQELAAYEKDNQKNRSYDDGSMSEGEWQAYGRYGY